MYAERVRGCDVDANAGVWAGKSVVSGNGKCECMGGARGSRIVSTADDVLQMMWCMVYVECVKFVCV